MNYYSTNNKKNRVTFREAIITGLANDKGLFMPEDIPVLKSSFIENLSNYSFQEISFVIAESFIGNEIVNSDLETIINSSVSFEAPVIELSNKVSVLELFHGPTLAFKDFGARFMARTIEHFINHENKKITILVATSGDTGSAVANGFLNVDGVNVVVLFPKDKVSKIQRKQITTLGNNITSLEVEGTFDDCQRLVKSAFMDSEIKKKVNLSSANSINIGRLIPQTFYYFESFKQFTSTNNTVYSIPSGNLGNLTSGLIAKKMGLPIKKFIAATNANNVFTEYIDSGIFSPRKSQITLSNAMDVGDPSNIARILDLFNNNHSLISNIILSDSFTDSQTLETMELAYKNFGYIFDPHGAIGLLALNKYLEVNKNDYGVVLETAHPAKFLDVFNKNLNYSPGIPKRLEVSMNKEEVADKISSKYNDFKDFLLS